MSADAPRADHAAVVAQLWARFRPLVDQRIDAVQAYADGTAPRADAAWAAHNLAGSLGSYGRADASLVARELDVLLADPEAPVTRDELLEMLGRLRAALQD